MAGLTEGTNVQTNNDHAPNDEGAGNQRFAITHNRTCGYTIQAKHSGLALDVATTNQNGSNITTKKINNTLNLLL